MTHRRLAASPTGPTAPTAVLPGPPASPRAPTPFAAVADGSVAALGRFAGARRTDRAGRPTGRRVRVQPGTGVSGRAVASPASSPAPTVTAVKLSASPTVASAATAVSAAPAVTATAVGRGERSRV